MKPEKEMRTFRKSSIKTDKLKTVQDIRKELFFTEKRLRNYKMKNKLAEKYRAKIEYMLMHLRLYSCKKSILDNWQMPDYSDIQKLRKVKP